MTRFQFLMLGAVESGAGLTQAMEQALEMGSAHPEWDLFERRSYQESAEAGSGGTVRERDDLP